MTFYPHFFTPTVPESSPTPEPTSSPVPTPSGMHTYNSMKYEALVKSLYLILYIGKFAWLLHKNLMQNKLTQQIFPVD